MALTKRERSWAVAVTAILVGASFIWPSAEHQLLGLAALVASLTGIKLPEVGVRK